MPWLALICRKWPDMGTEPDAGLWFAGEPLARRWLRHDWMAERHDYEDGDTNIIWGFAYIEFTPFKFDLQWFCNDGLLIRRIAVGWFAIGWGKTHEWFCCDD